LLCQLIIPHFYSFLEVINGKKAYHVAFCLSLVASVWVTLFVCISVSIDWVFFLSFLVSFWIFANNPYTCFYHEIAPIFFFFFIFTLPTSSFGEFEVVQSLFLTTFSWSALLGSYRHFSDPPMGFVIKSISDKIPYKWIVSWWALCNQISFFLARRVRRLPTCLCQGFLK
jgi:hypothetical protein